MSVEPEGYTVQEKSKRVYPTAKLYASRLADGTLAYTWQGPEDGLIAVTKETLEDAPDIIAQAPWPLERVGKGAWSRSWLYRRKTSGRPEK